MKAIVVGTGAGGAISARELANKGFEVLILEAGGEFKPFTRRISLVEPLRKLGLTRNEKNFSRFIPAYDSVRSSKDLILFRGMAVGGSTVLACGNMVRAEHGLKEIGLDLTKEFDEVEGLIKISIFPRERWRPMTSNMFESADELGLKPNSTPKAIDSLKCISCGLCEVGCGSGARWDSRRFVADAVNKGAVLKTKSPVKKIIIENGHAKGVIVGSGSRSRRFESDVVVLAAGGIGTPQILKASGLPAEDRLWVDIVLTLGGVSKGANQLNEPPMVWYTKEEDYILSPYINILSHFLHKPWKNVSIQDRVGLMVKLADEEQGTVYADGKVDKEITSHDRSRLDEAIKKAKQVMVGAGVSGPFIEGVHNGGHLGGTVPLRKEDLNDMKPSWLPDGLWVADLSLAPRSQGLPTILLTSALALRVARKIAEVEN
ncbi:MAG: GMC family oxidoreductase [Methanobacterium sp.]|nr:MAG: GMC family oxidoreductase [Methanobacterium sp.]